MFRLAHVFHTVTGAVQSHLFAARLSPPHPLVAVSPDLTDPYLSALSVISSTLISLSAACCLSADRFKLTTPWAPAADVGQPRQLFSISLLQSGWRGSPTDAEVMDWTGRSRPASPFREACFFPVGVAAFGSSGARVFLSERQWRGREGKCSSRPRAPQKQACDLSPHSRHGGWGAFPWQELPSGFRHGVLLNRGGRDERSAGLKLYSLRLCYLKLDISFEFLHPPLSIGLIINMWIGAFC